MTDPRPLPPFTSHPQPCTTDEMHALFARDLPGLWWMLGNCRCAGLDCEAPFIMSIRSADFHPGLGDMISIDLEAGTATTSPFGGQGWEVSGTGHTILEAMIAAYGKALEKTA